MPTIDRWVNTCSAADCCTRPLLAAYRTWRRLRGVQFTVNTCADRGGEGDDERDYCGERDFLWMRVIWAGWCPVSGSVCLQKRRACRASCVDRAAARCEGSMTGGGRRTRRWPVAQRVSSAAWASAAWPMAGRGGRVISRAEQLQRGLGGGEVDGGGHEGLRG